MKYARNSQKKGWNVTDIEIYGNVTLSYLHVDIMKVKYTIEAFNAQTVRNKKKECSISAANENVYNSWHHCLYVPPENTNTLQL